MEISPWTPVLIFFSLGLLMVNVFRFNILLVIAAVLINIALSHQPNTPIEVLVGAYFIAAAEAVAGFVKLVFGNTRARKRKRFTG